MLRQNLRYDTKVSTWYPLKDIKGDLKKQKPVNGFSVYHWVYPSYCFLYGKCIPDKLAQGCRGDRFDENLA